MDTQHRNRLLTVLFLGVLMAALDIAIVGPALPTLRDYFAIDDRAATWLFTIYVLFHLVGTPLMAKLSDTFGRRAVYQADLLLFALGSLTVALAPTFSVVLVGRAVQGFGSGGIFPVASAVIGDTFPPEKRGSALGLIGAVFGLAFLIGPVLGGILLLFGWRWLFAVNLPVVAVIMVMAAPLLPTRRVEGRPPFDWAGMTTLGVALAALTYGLNQLDTTLFWQSLLTWRVGGLALLALVLLGLFVRIERRAADPVIHLRLFKTRQLVIAGALAFGGGLGEAVAVFVPAYAIAAFGVGKSTASFLLMPMVLALAVGAPLAGKFLDRVGSRSVILAGTSMLTLGMLGLGIAGASWVLFIGALILAGLGLSALVGAPLRYIMLAEASLEDRAVAQALIVILTGVGQLVSGATIGAVIDSVGGGTAGYATAYSVAAVAAFGLLFLALWLKKRPAELAALNGQTRFTQAEKPAS